MAKTTAPFLGFGASGSVAKTLVASKWKGRSYVRQHVTPANPNSSEQQLTRNTFSWLQAVWKVAPTLVQDVWTLFAKGKVLTNRNAFTKFNNGQLRTETDLTNLTLSPGALGGLPATAVVATPGSGQLSVAVTEPTVLPDGWTIASAIVAVIPDQNPQSATLYNSFAGEDVSSPYTVVITGLDAVLYQVRAWLKWTRPDGSTAYSPDIATTGTPT